MSHIIVKPGLSPKRTQLLWLERLLWAVGLLCLALVAWAFIDARWYSMVQGHRLDLALQAARGAAARKVGASPAGTGGPGGPSNPGNQRPATPTAPSTAANPAGDDPLAAGRTDGLDAFRPGASAAAVPPAEEGSLIGRLEIPHAGISTLVLEGVSGSTLRRGVGHIPGTPLPQLSGNVGLAGHRDTVFRGLKDVRQNDLITLDTLAGSYEYRVDWTRVVEPADVAVLATGGRAELTLVTCYPFYYVGSAPQRYIVRAHLAEPAPGGSASTPATPAAGGASKL